MCHTGSSPEASAYKLPACSENTHLRSQIVVVCHEELSRSVNTARTGATVCSASSRPLHILHLQTEQPDVDTAVRTAPQHWERGEFHFIYFSHFTHKFYHSWAVKISIILQLFRRSQESPSFCAQGSCCHHRQTEEIYSASIYRNYWIRTRRITFTEIYGYLRCSLKVRPSFTSLFCTVSDQLSYVKIKCQENETHTWIEYDILIFLVSSQSSEAINEHNGEEKNKIEMTAI